MMLLTKENKKNLPNTDNDCGANPMIYVKWFHPLGNWTWYVAQYDPKTEMCFGMVHGFEKEWGYFSLAELRDLKVRGLGVERDLWFTPCHYNDIKD